MIIMKKHLSLKALINKAISITEMWWVQIALFIKVFIMEEIWKDIKGYE